MSVNLEVITSDAKYNKKKSNGIVTEQMSLVRLKCVVKCEHLIPVNYLHKITLLKLNEKHTTEITYDSEEHTIRKSKPDDSGRYECLLDIYKITNAIIDDLDDLTVKHVVQYADYQDITVLPISQKDIDLYASFQARMESSSVVMKFTIEEKYPLRSLDCKAQTPHYFIKSIEITRVNKYKEEKMNAFAHIVDIFMHMSEKLLIGYDEKYDGEYLCQAVTEMGFKHEARLNVGRPKDAAKVENNKVFILDMFKKG